MWCRNGADYGWFCQERIAVNRRHNGRSVDLFYGAARAILRTCRSIADRSEPVSIGAPWLGLIDEQQTAPGT